MSGPVVIDPLRWNGRKKKEFLRCKPLIYKGQKKLF